jgi:hypothetical protein
MAIIKRRPGGGPRAPIAETIPLAAVAEMAGPLEGECIFSTSDAAGWTRRGT